MRGDIVFRLTVPSARCGCSLPELMGWVVKANQEQAVVTSYLILNDGHEDLNLLLLGRISTAWDYSDAQLRAQLGEILAHMWVYAEDFYREINPKRELEYVFESGD